MKIATIIFVLLVCVQSQVLWAKDKIRLIEVVASEVYWYDDLRFESEFSPSLSKIVFKSIDGHELILSCKYGNERMSLYGKKNKYINTTYFKSRSECLDLWNYFGKGIDGDDDLFLNKVDGYHPVIFTLLSVPANEKKYQLSIIDINLPELW